MRFELTFISLQLSTNFSIMLRTILCTFLFLQVTHGWSWSKLCHYMERVNCDGYANSYHYHDGDYHHHHHGWHHDNDNHHGGWDHDNSHHGGWHHNHGDNDNPHHGGWHHGHGDNDNPHHGGWHHGHGDNDNHHHGGWDHDSSHHGGWHHHHGDMEHHHHGGWGSGWHHENWNGNKKVCGSDGVTYKNRCSYVKAKCQHTNIELRHDGACNADGKTTSKPTETDEFCKNIQQQPCHGVNPICGTNGQSYDNECEFEKAKCLDTNVHIKHLGTC